MAERISEEVRVLKDEFHWLLTVEVHVVLNQLRGIVQECCKRFPLPLPAGYESAVKSEKFVMNSTTQQHSELVKCVVNLSGDSVIHADISVRPHKHVNQTHRASIHHDNPWKLQQIQDAGNHMFEAFQEIENYKKDYQFKSADEVIHVLNLIMGYIQRGLSCLIVPKKKTLEDLQSSRNMKTLQPPLPSDMAVSFYVQSYKLMLAIYHIQYYHGATKFEVFQLECAVPWLNEALVFFSMALQLAQQLKDKFNTFSQYDDLKEVLAAESMTQNTSG